MSFPLEIPDVTVNGETEEQNDVSEEIKEKELKNEKIVTVNDIISHMVVLCPLSKQDILNKLKNVTNVLKDDTNAIKRVAKEISEDASNNGIKYFEVGVDPTKFISANEQSLSYSDVIQAALEGLKDGFQRTGTKGGIIIQCEKGKTEEVKGILTICDKFKDEGVVGVELTCNEVMIDTEIAGNFHLNLCKHILSWKAISQTNKGRVPKKRNEYNFLLRGGWVIQEGVKFY